RGIRRAECTARRRLTSLLSALRNKWQLGETATRFLIDTGTVSAPGNRRVLDWMGVDSRGHPPNVAGNRRVLDWMDVDSRGHPPNVAGNRRVLGMAGRRFSGTCAQCVWESSCFGTGWTSILGDIRPMWLGIVVSWTGWTSILGDIRPMWLGIVVSWEWLDVDFRGHAPNVSGNRRVLGLDGRRFSGTSAQCGWESSCLGLDGRRFSGTSAQCGWESSCLGNGWTSIFGDMRPMCLGIVVFWDWMDVDSRGHPPNMAGNRRVLDWMDVDSRGHPPNVAGNRRVLGMAGRRFSGTCAQCVWESSCFGTGWTSILGDIRPIWLGIVVSWTGWTSILGDIRPMWLGIVV